MANTLEIKVPDIGGHDNVPVIEVLVSVGDTVAKDQSLITLESDKATMEIPSTAAGTIKELKLKVGDEVSEGALIAVLEPTEWQLRRPRRHPPRHPRRSCTGSAPAPAGCRAGAEARPARVRPHAGHRMQAGGARFRPGRLHRRVPRRGSGRRHRAGRALRHARRRLPQRRLHPVQGAAACRCGDRRGRGDGCARRELRQADHRHRQAARLQDQGGRQAHRRPHQHGQAAQGAHRAGRGHASCRRTRWKSRRPRAAS